MIGKSASMGNHSSNGFSGNRSRLSSSMSSTEFDINFKVFRFACFLNIP